MQIYDIAKKIQGHSPDILEIKRSNAILIPLVRNEEGVSLLFELRSANVWQPGEVCFPGGGIEEDETVEEAAARECCEELGVKGSDIEILGRYDTVMGMGGFILYTCVAALNTDNIHINTDEVADYFTVPLSWFEANDPDEYVFPQSVQVPEDFDFSVFGVEGPYRWRKNEHRIYSWNYNGRHIWGLTAKIVYNFVEFLRETTK